MSSDRASGPAPGAGDVPSKRQVAVEDMLTLLSIGALFVLGVFFRTRMWATVALGAVLAVMLVLFIVRFRRLYRAFKAQRDSWL